MILLATLALALFGGPLRLDAKWTAESELPFSRVHALACVEGQYFVGGLRGLARRQAKEWESIDDRPVRDMIQVDDSVWVLFGDGSVDKIEPKADKLFFDVMANAAKRPWISCLGTSPTGALFGSEGGWIEKSDSLTQSYPKELQGQIVTAICRRQGDVWIGTQRNGLLRVSGSKTQRYGFLAGLPDSWVTALAVVDDDLYVGVADGGIVRIDGSKAVPVPCPAVKVRKMVTFRGRLVVGGMGGTWVQEADGWKRLGDEETTALSVAGDALAVGTPTGLTWWR